MYAGQKVEEAPVDELFAHPQHPYTMGLLGAVPRLTPVGAGTGTNGNGHGRRRLAEIPGLVPALSAPPEHCPFADRCPRADERSRSEVPRFEEVRPGHRVACFHPGQDGAA
jgi:peptide/nickel transport system ATP-binding protein